jgi:hypothetical protein
VVRGGGEGGELSAVSNQLSARVSRSPGHSTTSRSRGAEVPGPDPGIDREGDPRVSTAMAILDLRPRSRERPRGRTVRLDLEGGPASPLGRRDRRGPPGARRARGTRRVLRLRPRWPADPLGRRGRHRAPLGRRDRRPDASPRWVEPLRRVGAPKARPSVPRGSPSAIHRAPGGRVHGVNRTGVPRLTVSTERVSRGQRCPPLRFRPASPPGCIQLKANS